MSITFFTSLRNFPFALNPRGLSWSKRAWNGLPGDALFGRIGHGEAGKLQETGQLGEEDEDGG